MTDSFNSDTRILLGRKLSGRYVLTSLISSESGTQTWLARDLVLSRDVAVNLTDPFQITNSDHVSLFRKEAKIISRLNHPSIVTVLDTTGDEDLEAIVIELVKEETIFDYVERTGPLSLSLALQITKQIADALSYAHERGVLHGSLNPKHIFLCPDRGPQVTGFGFNKFRSLISKDLLSGSENDIGHQPVFQPDREALERGKFARRRAQRLERRQLELAPAAAAEMAGAPAQADDGGNFGGSVREGGEDFDEDVIGQREEPRHNCVAISRQVYPCTSYFQ